MSSSSQYTKVTSKTRAQYADDMALFAITECHKPNPDPMLKLLEKAGIHPSETLYIGGTLGDYQCTKNAGVDFALAL